MKVYLAFINDRHVDPDAEVFATFDSAKAYVDGYLVRATSYGERQIEEHVPPPDGWLYSATYSVEDDSVWIVEKGVTP